MYLIYVIYNSSFTPVFKHFGTDIAHIWGLKIGSWVLWNLKKIDSRQSARLLKYCTS